MKKFNRYNKGFTLIELLVVISIIAILSSLALATYKGAQDKAKKSVFVQEMYNMQKALEIYKIDTGFYPYENVSNFQPLQIYNYSNILTDTMTPGLSTISFNNISQKPFIPTYLSKVPSPIPGIAPISYLEYRNSSYAETAYGTCGGKPFKGYILYFLPDESGTLELNLSLPKLTSGDYSSNIYCLTGE